MARPGCCVDGSCTESTCMRLPDGITCEKCFHAKRCLALGWTRLRSRHCDFFPRRFREGESPKPEPVGSSDRVVPPPPLDQEVDADAAINHMLDQIEELRRERDRLLRAFSALHRRAVEDPGAISGFAVLVVTREVLSYEQRVAAMEDEKGCLS